jgi:hypothetical protein
LRRRQMMNIKFANTVATVISALFPGGITEFNKKGQITVLPYPSRTIVVYHPDLPENIKSRLLAVLDKANEKFKAVKDEDDRKNVMLQLVFMTTPNFVEFDGDRLRDSELALVKFFNKIEPSASMNFENISNLIVVTMPNINSEKDESLPLIFDHLKNLQGLALAYIITKNSIHIVKPSPKRWKKVPVDDKTKMVPNNVNEDKVITKDDIINLIINIENAKSVDDFIKGM